MGLPEEKEVFLAAEPSLQSHVVVPVICLFLSLGDCFVCLIF